MLEIRNLNYNYPGSQFGIKNISLSIERSKVHGLVGENGAGKSTLFLNTLGLLKMNSGEILLDKTPLRFKKDELRDYRTRVNLVMQNPDKQIFYSNVKDDIVFPLRNLKRSEEFIEKKLEELSDKLGIRELLDRPTHALSYGQKKRVAIAGVLAMEPEYILFDEPTAGLDPRLTENMRDLIGELKSDGIGILISSHDMDFIYDVCDDISVISKGEIIASGKKSEVFVQKELLIKAGLREPTLARLHNDAGLPLFDNMDNLIQYLLK